MNAQAQTQEHNNIHNNTITQRETVGVFADDEHLLAAIDDLEMAEFNRQDISVLGSEGKMRKTYHKAQRNPYSIEADPKAPRGVHITPEEQSLAEASLVGGGVLLAVFLAGPVIGANMAVASNVVILLAFAAVGGAIGYGIARLLRSRRSRSTHAQERKGGLLLWVSTSTQEREAKAQSILKRNGARDVHVNEIEKNFA